MRIQIVHHQHHLFNIRVALVETLSHALDPVDLRSAISRKHHAMGRQRLKEHEQVRCPVPLVVVIMAVGRSGLCLDWIGVVPQKLARHLVGADYRAIRVVRAPVDRKDIFQKHIPIFATNRVFLLRRDPPLLVQMRLESV